MYKEDLVLNNLQWLICHKIRRNDLVHALSEDLYEKNFWLVFIIPFETQSSELAKGIRPSYMV